MRLRPHQEALCCLISMHLLLLLNRKAETFNERYHKKAGELDLEQGTAPGSMGSFQRTQRVREKRPSDRSSGGGLY
jgi:hypothetical protein